MKKWIINMNFDISDVIISIYTIIISFVICFLTVNLIILQFDLSETYAWQIIFACTILFFLPVRKLFFGYLK